jgi:hypothetical protein
MKSIVENIAGQVKSLSDRELEESLSWLSDYEFEQSDEWDKEIERDSQAGGRLSAVFEGVRADIASGGLKRLDEVLCGS